MAHPGLSASSSTRQPTTGRQGGRLVTRWFADRRVATKILAATSVLAAAILVVGAVGITSIRAVTDAGNRVVALQTGLVAHRATVHQDQLKARLIAAQVAAADTPDQLKAWQQKSTDNDAELDQSIAQMHREGAERVIPAWPAFLKDFAAWRAYRDTTLMPLAVLTDKEDTGGYAKAALGDSQDLIDIYLDRLDTAAAQLDARARREQAAADADASDAVRQLVVVGLAGLLLGLGLALYVARLIVGPLGKVSDVLNRLAAGDVTGHVDVDSRDELGTMATALNTASASLRRTVTAMAENAEALGAAAGQLSTTSNDMAAAAGDASSQAGVVAVAAEQVSANVQTVAAGTEQMGASIREIAQSAADAARVAAQAVTFAARTTDTVTKLGVSSQEIGDVLKTITTIAGQTNLLALNATIEAARAGDAGRGFAVVAGEVKELAQETAKATEDIARRIEAIQADTSGAVTAIGEISQVVDQINDYQTTIAAAVEEQTATTNEMARYVADAATGSTDIAANIVGVANAADTTSGGVQQTQRSAADLARMSSELQTLVAAFTF
jgi:methyl-accepting chemotaxis protein